MLYILHLTPYTLHSVDRLKYCLGCFSLEAYTATFVISVNDNGLMKGTLQITAYIFHKLSERPNLSRRGASDFSQPFFHFKCHVRAFAKRKTQEERGKGRGRMNRR